jgi:hypothetical protein
MLGKRKEKRSGQYRFTLFNKVVRVGLLSDWFPLQTDAIQKYLYIHISHFKSI